MLVVFDPKTHLEAGLSTTILTKDATLQQSYTQLTGSMSLPSVYHILTTVLAGPYRFSPVVIPANQFWLTISFDDPAPKWGFKFWAVPLVPALMDEEVPCPLPPSTQFCFLFVFLGVKQAKL
jgi:hypothetical protein